MYFYIICIRVRFSKCDLCSSPLSGLPAPRRLNSTTDEATNFYPPDPLVGSATDYEGNSYFNMPTGRLFVLSPHLCGHDENTIIIRIYIYVYIMMYVNMIFALFMLFLSFDTHTHIQTRTRARVHLLFVCVCSFKSIKSIYAF